MKAGFVGVILCRLSKSGHHLRCIGASTKQEARQPDVLQGQFVQKSLHMPQKFALVIIRLFWMKPPMILNTSPVETTFLHLSKHSEPSLSSLFHALTVSHLSLNADFLYRLNSLAPGTFPRSPSLPQFSAEPLFSVEGVVKTITMQNTQTGYIVARIKVGWSSA